MHPFLADVQNFALVGLAVFGKAGLVDLFPGENAGEPQGDRTLDLDLQDRAALGQEGDPVQAAREIQPLGAVAGICVDGQSQLAVRLIVGGAVVDDQTGRSQIVVVVAEGGELPVDLTVAGLGLAQLSITRKREVQQ